MVLKAGKLQRSKQRWQNLCWKVHDSGQPFWFCAHTLWLNYLTETFLLVSYSDSTQNLVFCARSRPKKRTKTWNKALCWASWLFPFINFEETEESTGIQSNYRSDLIVCYFSLCFKSKGKLLKECNLKYTNFAQVELCIEDLHQYESFINKIGFGNFLDAEGTGGN